MTRSILVTCALAVLGCGGTSTPKTRPQIEVRRDAACEALGPKLTDCAIADARANATPEELAELDVEKIGPRNTEKFIAACKNQQLSSRQVRVYEVCLEEETECEPLISCLDNVNGAAP